MSVPEIRSLANNLDQLLNLATDLEAKLKKSEHKDILVCTTFFNNIAFDSKPTDKSFFSRLGRILNPNRFYSIQNSYSKLNTLFETIENATPDQRSAALNLLHKQGKDIEITDETAKATLDTLKENLRKILKHAVSHKAHVDDRIQALWQPKPQVSSTPSQTPSPQPTVSQVGSPTPPPVPPRSTSPAPAPVAPLEEFQEYYDMPIGPGPQPPPRNLSGSQTTTAVSPPVGAPPPPPPPPQSRAQGGIPKPPPPPPPGRGAKAAPRPAQAPEPAVQEQAPKKQPAPSGGGLDVAELQRKAQERQKKQGQPAEEPKVTAPATPAAPSTPKVANNLGDEFTNTLRTSVIQAFKDKFAQLDQPKQAEFLKKLAVMKSALEVPKVGKETYVPLSVLIFSNKVDANKIDQETLRFLKDLVKAAALNLRPANVQESAWIAFVEESLSKGAALKANEPIGWNYIHPNLQSFIQQEIILVRDHEKLLGIKKQAAASPPTEKPKAAAPQVSLAEQAQQAALARQARQKQQPEKPDETPPPAPPRGT